MPIAIPTVPAIPNLQTRRNLPDPDLIFKNGGGEACGLPDPDIIKDFIPKWLITYFGCLLDIDVRSCVWGKILDLPV